MVIPIINDNIAEPRESFICTLQAGIVDSIQAIFPSKIMIEIRDDDGEQIDRMSISLDCYPRLLVFQARLVCTGVYYDFMKDQFSRNIVSESVAVFLQS